MRGGKRQSLHNDTGEEGNDKGKKVPKTVNGACNLLQIDERGQGFPVEERTPDEYYVKLPYNLEEANRLVTPWWKQVGRDVKNGQLQQGAFESESHRLWCNDVEAQAKFAQYFRVPWKETIPLRHVSSDTYKISQSDPLSNSSNSTAKVLKAVYLTHPPLQLTHVNEPIIEQAFVASQHTDREMSKAMNGGPFGGLKGKANVVLYWFSKGDGAEVTNTNAEILQLVKLISELMRLK